MDLFVKMGEAYDVEKVQKIIKAADSGADGDETHQWISVFWDDGQFGVAPVTDVLGQEPGPTFGHVMRVQYGPKVHEAVFITTGNVRVTGSSHTASSTSTMGVTRRSRRRSVITDYVTLETPRSELPAGYQLLTDSSCIAVRSDWLVQVVHKLRRKAPGLAVKLMLEYFMTPQQYGKTGGTSAFKGTEWEKVIEALELFGVTKLRMTPSEATRSLNEKMFSGRRYLANL